MKIKQLFCILSVLSVTGLVSCKPEEKVSFGTPVTVSISDASTNGNSWKSGDQIKALFDDVVVTLTNKSEDGAAALFKGTVKSEQYELVKAFSPAACFISKGTEATANVAIPASQQPSLTEIDNRADFWIAEPIKDVTIKGDEVLETTFSRASAIVKVVLNDPKGEFSGKLVKSVSIETAGVSLAGEAVIDLVNKSLNCSGSNLVTASYNPGFSINGSNAALFAVAPATFSSDDIINVTVNTGDDTCCIELPCGESGVTTFKAGEVTIIKVDVVSTTFKGSGTAEDPWMISNFADLQNLSSLVAEDQFNEGYFALASDINIPEGQVFTPIGSSEHPFNGNFDGAGKTISGLNLADIENSGLFGYVSKPAEESDVVSVTIKNLTINGLKFASEEIENPNHAAIVGNSGKGSLTISACTVKNSNISASEGAAGLVAIVHGTTVIENCVVSSTNISGARYSAGAISRISTSSPVAIQNCAVGSDSKILANATSGSGCLVGGLVGAVVRGFSSDVKIDNCAVYADVFGQIQIIGGIVGGAAADLTNSASENQNKGGCLVVSNSIYQGGTISTGNTGDQNAFMGGIVGLGSRTAPGEDGISGGLAVHIINCASRPSSVVCKVGPGTGRWSFGGISGGMFAAVKIWNCWSDISESKLDLCDGNLGYGAITPQMQANTTGNSIDYAFGIIKLKNAGAGKIDNHDGSDISTQSALVPANITEVEMTDGTLLSKLTTGATAYEGGKATLAAWNAGEGGYPVLAGIPSDPDKK